MDDSDSSALSSAPPSDDEAMQVPPPEPKGLERYFKPAPKDAKSATPEPPKRAPSPPHEYTLADSDAIAILVMFRSRFSDAFPKSLPHCGPQDIERGVSGDLPDEQVERYLCALLGLVLNRKKDVERGHYSRALEDAVAANQNQWLTVWQGKNPLHSGKSFNNMAPQERLLLLKALALWSLNSSETVQSLMKESYKQTRRDDDKNQPRSVQPWFSDSYRRRYWLIEGLEESHFRVYRENDGKTAKSNTWFSVAGTIDEINALADKFLEEGTTNAKINSEKLRSAIPRFEAGEEKRRRREYRQMRKAQFARPEPGFSLYEGRTRGKRIRYTYDDNDVDDSDGLSTRRSTRNATPAETGPTITASGRQVKSRQGGVYGESLPTDQRREIEAASGVSNAEEESDDIMPMTAPRGRPMRAAARAARPIKKRDRSEFDGQTDTESDEAQSSGNEWSGNEDEPDADVSEEDDFDEVSDEGIGDVDDEGDVQQSLVVQLRYRKLKGGTPADSGARTPSEPVQGMETKQENGGLEAREVKALPTPDKSSDYGASEVEVKQANAEDTTDVPQQAQQGPLVNGVHEMSAGPGKVNGIPHHHSPSRSLQPMDVS